MGSELFVRAQVADLCARVALLEHSAARQSGLSAEMSGSFMNCLAEIARDMDRVKDYVRSAVTPKVCRQSGFAATLLCDEVTLESPPLLELDLEANHNSAPSSEFEPLTMLDFEILVDGTYGAHPGAQAQAQAQAANTFGSSME